MGLDSCDNIKSGYGHRITGYIRTLGDRNLKQFSLAEPLSQALLDADVSIGSYLKRRFLYRWATVTAYLALPKIRSATLNSLSALLGVLLAAGSSVPWGTAAVLAASVWLAAAGAGAINSYLDRDIDRVMQRTSHRPLPLGVIQPAERALYAGVSLTLTGLLIAALWLNLMATLFIALGAGAYIFVYTLWLKRKTPWSIIIGGLAGSCALLAGWFSVTNSFSLFPLLFSIFIFLWTPGHFWGLAIRTKEDSELANIPTLATRYGEKTATKWASFLNIILIPISAIPYLLGMLGEIYLITSITIGLVILFPNIKLFFTPTRQRAWTVFKISSPYLAVVYLAVFLDIMLG